MATDAIRSKSWWIGSECIAWLAWKAKALRSPKAEQYIEQLRADARRDRLNLPGAQGGAWVSVAADDYLKRLAADQGRDLANKRCYLELHLKPFLATNRSQNLGIRSTTLHPPPAKRRAANATINREISCCSHLLHRAVEWAWIDRVPKVPRLREDNRRLVYLMQDQIQKKRLWMQRGRIPAGKFTRSS